MEGRGLGGILENRAQPVPTLLGSNCVTRTNAASPLLSTISRTLGAICSLA
jgi:hypothetical protein